MALLAAERMPRKQGLGIYGGTKLMTENRQSFAKSRDVGHRIWEGCVGIYLHPQRKSDGNYFWKYTLVRGYKQMGCDEWNYSYSFSQKNNQAIAVVLSKGMRFMNENNADDFVARVCSQLN